MSSIIKHKDKRTGIIYCYESTSYWDKERKQPRSRRRLIGKLDPETGEIVPTGAKGRPRKETSASPVQDVPSQDSVPNDIVEVLSQKNREIVQLQAEIRRLIDRKSVV